MAGLGRKRLVNEDDIRNWAKPDIHALSPADQVEYAKRTDAVIRYARGETFDQIRSATDKCESEVRRFAKKCMRPDGSGAVVGFLGMVPGVRDSRYVRKEDLPEDFVGGRAGLSGALGHVLNKYPDIALEMRQKFFGNSKGKVVSNRPGYKEMQQTFLGLLRKKLVEAELDPEYFWPFNSRDQGYQAVYQYCKLMEVANDQAVRLRAGKAAAAALRIGTGREPLIKCIRPFTYAQMDYHKVDTKCVIVIKTASDNELLLKVARWYFGMIVDEDSGAILGAHIAFELNPSADAALETVENALSPIQFAIDDARIKYCEDGKVFLQQIVSGLEYQTFSVLKIDNAWAHASKDFIDNVIAMVGCAICLGTPFAWAQRDLIEKIFGLLARAGLQRLSATTGSGPTDPKRDDPDKAAVEDRILLSDLEAIIYSCIQQHNHSPSVRTQYSTPVEHIEAVRRSPKRGFIYAPLPRASVLDMRLLWHTCIVTVRGNPKKGRRPYFSFEGIEHSNKILAKDWELIGQKLRVTVNRRCARIVQATIVEGGKSLGFMLVRGAWAKSNVSLRNRRMITSAGKTKQKRLSGHNPMDKFFDEKSSQKVSQAAALAMGKSAIEAQRPEVRSAHSTADAIYDAEENKSTLPLQLPEPIVIADIGAFAAPMVTAKLPGQAQREITGDPFGLLSVPSTTSPRRK